MAKNIVICSDGTWNSAYKRRGTNVFKLYEALDHTQGLLCLGIVALAYAASGWARTKIQDRGAAMWRGGTTSGESA